MVVHLVVTGVGVMTVMDAAMQRRSSRRSGFFPESGEQLELEGMHISVLSHPTIWRWLLLPRQCRPGKTKRRSVSPCFPLWRTCSSAQPRRQRIDCLRCRAVDAILRGTGTVE